MSGAVELERVMPAVQRIGRVSFGGGDELLGEVLLSARGQGVEHVDRDVHAGGRWDRCCEERDRPIEVVVRGLPYRRPTMIGLPVALGELLLGPGPSELPVGLVEVDHRFIAA